jgi:hypothetical protein
MVPAGAVAALINGQTPPVVMQAQTPVAVGEVEPTIIQITEVVTVVQAL